MIDTDKFKDECGVVAVCNHKEAFNLCKIGLHALQHRGQDSFGVTTLTGAGNDKSLVTYHREGIVSHDQSKAVIEGHYAIAHVRYATSGSEHDLLLNAQPILKDSSIGKVSIAHNGHLSNIKQLRALVESKGYTFTTSTDTEVITYLIDCSEKSTEEEKIIEALQQIEGAYSLLIMTSKSIYAARDPKGFRPFVVGKNNESYVFASESCALDILEADFLYDVQPGELVKYDLQNDTIIKKVFLESKTKNFCIFEYIYFARPDSIIHDKSVYHTRKNIGKILAKKFKETLPDIECDLIIPVPDSGLAGALGFSEEMKIPFEYGLIRNHYIGRTFIAPTQSLRVKAVKLKHNVNQPVIKGKKVILVDDSIVRGTTSRHIIKMIREAGALEVHFVITSPPTKSPCYYGINTPDKSSLIANKSSQEEIRQIIDADSLLFLSLDDLHQAVEGKNRVQDSGYCDACFSEEYPI